MCAQILCSTLFFETKIEKRRKELYYESFFDT